MRALPLVIALSIAVAAPATAQLAAPTQPTQRLLVLPFQASAADSAGSIALADAARDRVTALAKAKVQVVPKAKLCEALKQSGFPCDGLLDDVQARQLAKFLQVHAYVTGAYKKEGASLTADVRMIDIASSGMATSFVATNGNPGTAAALADAIAQKLNTVIRASEPIQACNDDRKKGQFARAKADAQKALVTDPNSVGAHLCLATVYEAQRMTDSVLVESQRALKGDSLNGTAWENIFRIYQQRNDTVNMVNALIAQLRGEPRNVAKRLGIAQLLRQMKDFDRAVAVLDDGLKIQPGETQLNELKLTICTEANKYACSARTFYDIAQHDTSKVSDTTFLKPAIGAAQQASDTMVYDYFTAAAVKGFPTNASFLRARASAYDMRGKPDSSLVWLAAALKIEPNDVNTSLLIGKAMVDRAQYDTLKDRELKARKDSVGLRALQDQFATRIDSARTYLNPGISSRDSSIQLNTAAIMRSAGEKLVRAGAGERALPWLDKTLELTGFERSTPSDTAGPRAAVRRNAAFWYGLASVGTLSRDFGVMAKTKNCDQAKDFNDRLIKIKRALQTGRGVHPPTVDNLLVNVLPKFDQPMASVKKAYKCRNF